MRAASRPDDMAGEASGSSARPAGSAWRRRLDPMAVTTGALIANTGVTSILGMVFWLGASRVYSARQVGEDAALISAMTLLSVISQLNLAIGIPRLLPQVSTRRWRPVAAAYAVTGLVAVAVTTVFVTVAPRVSGSFGSLRVYPLLAAALILAVVLWNVFALQDAVLTATRWATVIPLENGVFGALKIGLMLLFAGSFAGHGIFIGWLLAMAVLLIPVNAFIFGRVLPAASRTKVRAEPTLLRLTDRSRVTRYLAVDYLGALLHQGYTAGLPLLVVAVLGQAANAYFYIAFVIATAVRAVAQSMSTSLVVEGAHDESMLGTLTRLSIRRYVRYAVPGTALLALGSSLILQPFGADYAAEGTPLLRLLLVGTLPQAVVTLYLGVERVRARVSRVLTVEAMTAVLLTAGVVVGMRSHGLVGVGLGWLVAQTVAAVLVGPHLWSVCRQARPLLSPVDG